MQNKTKSLLMLLSVLIIGFVLGVLSSGALRHLKGERIFRMSPEEQFHKTMENIIQPTDSQRKAIEQILERESERIASIQQQRSMEFFAVFDSSRRALDALLTDKQKEQLEQHMQKTREKFAEMEAERLSRVLDLDTAQKQQIKEIIARIPSRPDTELELMGGMQDFQKVKQNFELMDNEINKVLSPEQREKYREFRSRRPMPFERPRMHPMNN